MCVAVAHFCGLWYTLYCILYLCVYTLYISILDDEIAIKIEPQIYIANYCVQKFMSSVGCQLLAGINYQTYIYTRDYTDPETIDHSHAPTMCAFVAS